MQALTIPLGIVFGQGDDDESNDYEVFHSARILLIDPKVRLKALFSSPYDVYKIASDYTKIIDS